MKWLAELLVNGHFSWTTTRFLKDTEVVYREGAAEKAVEWGQSRDQEGEDQLGDS